MIQIKDTYRVRSAIGTVHNVQITLIGLNFGVFLSLFVCFSYFCLFRKKDGSSYLSENSKDYNNACL